MTVQREVLVFDTGPLSHFALAGWLGMLRLLVGDREAVIPDTAKDHQVSHLPTLRLLCEAVRAGHATVELVSGVADHLIETEYRLPFKAGGFAEWAKEHNLLVSDTGLNS
jgi:hypothetical protein